jgi:hypothetical protein
MRDLTETERAEMVREFGDPAKFSRECLSIRNPQGSLKAMEQSGGQRKLSAAIKSQRDRRAPVRIVALKTRRSQFTSGCVAEIFHEIPFFAGRRALTISKDFTAAREAFDYVMQYDIGYTPMKRFGHVLHKPRLIKPMHPRTPVPQGTMLEAIWENGAAWDTLSAFGGDIGRGVGRQAVLFDELAWCRNATLSLTAALNTVPDEPETMILVPSTANGIGGEFYDLCQLARDPGNAGGWLFVFFGWLEHEPYQMDLPANPAVFQASLNNEERLLMELHSATLRQLAWRRWKISTACRGDVELFHQEYPTTPEEAFISSGRPVFDHMDLARHPVTTGITGSLEVIQQGPMQRLVFIPRDDARGMLTIWRRPEPGRLYTASADPSEGKDVSLSKRGENPDYAVIQVCDTLTGEQVARYRARTRPGAFAEMLALIGRWYNWAFLVPEANNAGFIDSLLNTGYPIEQLYNRRRDPTDRQSLQPQELGFYTDGQSRTWLVGAAEDAIRTMSIQIHDQVTINECQTFVVKPNSKHEHQANCHDDCVITIGLLEIGRRSAPRKPPPSLQPLPRRQFVTVGGKRKLRPDEEE